MWVSTLKRDRLDSRSQLVIDLLGSNDASKDMHEQLGTTVYICAWFVVLAASRVLIRLQVAVNYLADMHASKQQINRQTINQSSSGLAYNLCCFRDLSVPKRLFEACNNVAGMSTLSLPPAVRSLDGCLVVRLLFMCWCWIRVEKGPPYCFWLGSLMNSTPLILTDLKIDQHQFHSQTTCFNR
jgi:hypothetical protein